MALPTLAYALIAVDWTGNDGPVWSAPVAGFALLASGLMGLLLCRRYSRPVEGLVLLFDGRGWFDGSGVPATVSCVYVSASLLALRVEVAGRRYPLLLSSAQFSREGWRRLSLCLGRAARGR